MSADALRENRTLIERFTDQPARLPAEVRERIEREAQARTERDSEPVQLYALSDLDASLALRHEWVALTPSYLAVARTDGDNGAEPIRLIERDRIRKVRVEPGLSCNQLLVMGEPDDPALVLFRYSHRQRRTMENIQFVLEQSALGHPVAPEVPDEVYADGMSRPIRDAQASIAANSASVIRRLMKYLYPYRWRLTLGMLGAMVVTALSLVPPYLTGYLIDDILRPFQMGELTQQQAYAAATPIIVIIAVVYALWQIFQWIRLRTMTVLGEFVARDLRLELYEHIQSLSLSYFSKKRTGSLISRVSSDTDRLWQFIAIGAVDLSLSIVMLIGLGTILIALDWQLGLVLMMPLPVIFWWIKRHGAHMTRNFLRAWRKWSGLTSILSDTIAGIRVVKAFNQEDKEKARFREKNETCAQEFTRIHTAWTSFWPLMMGCMRAMMVLVWALALPRIILSDSPVGGLSVGTFVSFLLYMGMLMFPLQVIGQITFVMNRATSSAHRIFEVLDTRPEVDETATGVRLDDLKGRVTFENVTFAYDGVRQVLQGITFDVQPGEMIGLVGPSGAGKTTITNLIVRFYDPTGGGVRIDGVDLQELDIGHLRRQVGMVLQDPYLFHGSVLDNIRYGLPDASPADVVRAARAANAHDFVSKLSHGYDTMVGERGHTLSGGERQRLSIARAILGDPRILILDEATSSVDTETERKIQEALDRLVAGRTVFAIAHRLSTLQAADRLFVIEEGRITEQGTHEELLQKEDGTYRKLSTMQQDLHASFAV